MKHYSMIDRFAEKARKLDEKYSRFVVNVGNVQYVFDTYQKANSFAEIYDVNVYAYDAGQKILIL